MQIFKKVTWYITLHRIVQICIVVMEYIFLSHCKPKTQKEP